LSAATLIVAGPDWSDKHKLRARFMLCMDVWNVCNLLITALNQGCHARGEGIGFACTGSGDDQERSLKMDLLLEGSSAEELCTATGTDWDGNVIKGIELAKEELAKEDHYVKNFNPVIAEWLAVTVDYHN
jgi:hypothetical protein